MSYRFDGDRESANVVADGVGLESFELIDVGDRDMSREGGGSSAADSSEASATALSTLVL